MLSSELSNENGIAGAYDCSRAVGGCGRGNFGVNTLKAIHEEVLE
jgi:hypothetical protein